MMIRKLLSARKSAPIDDVIRSEVLLPFSIYLTYDSYPDLQFESVWAISNVLSGTTKQCEYVMGLGNCVQNIVRLLGVTPVETIREQAAWAVGNLAGEGFKIRDYLFELQVVDAMLNALTQPATSLRVIKQCAWAMANLVRNKPHPALNQVIAVLPALTNLIQHEDPEIAQEACWAVSYISDGDHSRIQALIDQRILPRVVELMQVEDPHMQLPALRIVGNVITGSDDQTQVALECQCLNFFAPLLKSPSKAVRKEAVWTLSNVAAGNKGQIQELINANFFTTIVNENLFDPERDVRKEAVWVLNNTATGGALAQVDYMVSNLGVLEALADVLKRCLDPWEQGEGQSTGNNKLLALIMETIYNIAALSDSFIDRLEQTDVADLIEQMQKYRISQEAENRSIDLITLINEGDPAYGLGGPPDSHETMMPFSDLGGAFGAPTLQQPQFNSEGDVANGNDNVSSGAFNI